jgi:nickel-dependent lactate racemase
MTDITVTNETNGYVSDGEILQALEASLEGLSLQKVLLIPPDLTRSHSYAGRITALYYGMLSGKAQVDILPALGTHDPMTGEECADMFGDGIPFGRFIAHNWRTDVVSIGRVPGDFVKEVSGGLLDYEIDISINKVIIECGYDLIISIGQVVPHEVVGMANFSKNILVGCAGKDVINKTHMLGAVCGMEAAMGRDHSPVRKVLDYAQESFLSRLPLIYVLTVTVSDEEGVKPQGIFIGENRTVFEKAVKLSAEKNIQVLDKPIKKAVVYLDPSEFRSTWLGNKAIYRTRMAVADGGELLILAPGVRKFGEDKDIDSLIRKYGYTGSRRITELSQRNDDLSSNLSAAAHLIHGSSEGRFTITYAALYMSEEEIRGAGFGSMPFAEAIQKYDPSKLKEGWNITDDNEEVYFISNPALGLWAQREKFC